MAAGVAAIVSDVGAFSEFPNDAVVKIDHDENADALLEAYLRKLIEDLVYKMYKAAFGNLPGKPVAVDRTPFMNDTRQIQSTPAQVIVGQGNWQAQLETNKQAFALAFVQRSAFQTAHASQDAATYVNSLFANAGVASLDPSEVSAAVNAFNNA